MNNITIELCVEDRTRLDRLQATLDRLQAAMDKPTVAPATVTPATPVAPYEAADAAPDVAEANTQPEPEPVAPREDPEPVAPKYKLTDVQQAVVSLSAAGKKDQVREIVKAYAERVTLIPEDKFAEVMDKLHALDSGSKS